jgi:hypothetical protein
MIGTGADFAFAACVNHIPGTVLVRAEKRSATMDTFFFTGFGRIEGGGWTWWIA